MGTVKEKIPPLVEGESMTWEEFEERFDATPSVKHAELIGGKVHMTPPASNSHAEAESDIGCLLKIYAVKTPGCKAATSATCRMLTDAPMPDACLRIHENYGGQSRLEGQYVCGAPELLVEVCVSSAIRDLHDKKDLYRRAGVKDYIAILPEDGKLFWHRLSGDKYELLHAEQGIIRSTVFPGLRINAEALLSGDMERCLEVLNEGLASPEHLKFVAELARKKGR